ncbi:hypothetical protein [Oceanithermus desulfurans]|uniref:Uncharacterized protein n=2 Tax=Oceanithermus desulfurans TaxID=227924 RepID=A0A511RH65_9DEIN|nr:hypothetical protein [Oceanithermus desulfurans]MBB6028923.1 hypothetical protein [Oceanithermus desulfurans]GEM88980.1 hypothetical protein ODE01S_04140 [Oceanithermus desulfurans NBRC 100063]
MSTQEFLPEDALRAARHARSKARGVLGRFVGQLLALWGAIYLVMYGGGALGWLPPWAWAPIDLAGFAISFGLGARIGEAFRMTEGGRLRRIWAWFGVVMALAVFAFAFHGVEDPLFSFSVNLLVAYALVQSGEAVQRPGLVRGGLLLALVNAAFLAFWPGAYAPALAGMGLLALVAGLRQVVGRAL